MSHVLGSDTMGSVDLIPQSPLHGRHIYTFSLLFFSFLFLFFFSFTLFSILSRKKQLSLYTPTWQLCYIFAQINLG